MRKALYLTVAAIAGLGWGNAAAKTNGYYQMPAMDSSHLVFASEGDLWRAAPTGGTAVRLTTHPEAEANPFISPDGKWIAFQANYDGPTEIYVMPMAGGKPKRVTFEGGGVTPRGWLDNDRVLYRTSNIPGTIPRLLRTVNVDGLGVTDIPLDGADQTAMSPDGRTLVFTRYGLNMFSDNAVQYRGGRMAQLWTYTLGSAREAVRLAKDFDAPIRHPMIWNKRIYFVTDKSGTDNIWSMDMSGGDIQQVTQSREWQIRAPMLHNGKIIYQSGADLFTYDIAAATLTPVTLDLTSDRDMQRVRWLDTPLEYLDDARMAPSGKSVTVTARGHFVTGFTGQQRRVNYKLPADARARSAVMGADGDWVYALVDRDLSGEIWKFKADGSGEGEAVKTGIGAYIWNIYAAPKDEALVYSDKAGKLYHLDVKTGKTTLIDSAVSSSDDNYSDVSWSQDGRYLTYTFGDSRDILQIAIFDTKTGVKTVMTSGKFESFAPTFSSDSAWLYFVSNRNFEATPGSPWGDRNMGAAFNERGKLYALQLDPKAAFPFEPKDELDVKDDEKAKDKDSEKDGGDETAKDSEKDEKEESPVLDLSGAADRLWPVPAPAGDYSGLAATKKHLYVMGGGFRSPVLKRLSISDDEPELDDYAKDVRSFGLSADGKTLFLQVGRGARTRFMLVGSGESYPKDTSPNTIRLSDWKLAIDPHDEWRQMALDAWRLHRDFAYDKNLRGVNWNAVREHFIPMADRLGHRAELNDLLSQMSAELGILHSQIRQGELPTDEEGGNAAYLGAVFEPAKDGLLIRSIHAGEPDRPETWGPLQSPGVDARAGDVLTAVDGQAIRTQADLALALTEKAGQQVRLELQRGKARHSEIVVPASRRGELGQQYTSWVQHNREAVEAASGGKVGYLHLRAMGSNDVASFARDYFEHVDKDGMIIDVRGNRGGNIDSWIIGTLLRRVWAYWPGANGGPSMGNMQQTFRGHLVVLIDEGTYSDGETFAAGVRALDIAPTMGTRTAGAGIWLSDRNRLVDGGQARVAEFGQRGASDGRWLIEGRGVSPDIEVTNPPKATYDGGDNQLSTAVTYLQNKIANEPIPELKDLPYPALGEPGRGVK